MPDKHKGFNKCTLITLDKDIYENLSLLGRLVFFIVKSPILISLIPVFYWLRSTDYNGDTQIDAGMGARSEQSPLELMLPAKH